MTAEVNHFIALCRQHDNFPYFLSYHCIIHQQVSGSKRFTTKTVMDITFKIVKSVHGRSLQDSFSTFDKWAAEIILHSDVRRLCRNKFLQRFNELLNDISFLKKRRDDKAELENKERLCDLAFLTGIYRRTK
ncbi:hypothetical protein JRQ81_017588 [Phrynocephalus forsythii]|uniref:Uncharacterized protein n=1 Tax=Phrynocephalus forsythii TaxID=171643 RepID=A0A9Q1B041_9SAUR|nr:hypothetical protein JRQ81_017588 [Phrynocephalus forsythii]